MGTLSVIRPRCRRCRRPAGDNGHQLCPPCLGLLTCPDCYQVTETATAVKFGCHACRARVKRTLALLNRFKRPNPDRVDHERRMRWYASCVDAGRPIDYETACLLPS